VQSLKIRLLAMLHGGFLWLGDSLWQLVRTASAGRASRLTIIASSLIFVMMFPEVRASMSCVFLPNGGIS
jgi:hypothetical protein